VPPREPTLEEIRDFWQEHPIGDSHIRSRATLYDYFREFDNVRESPDVEPYELSNLVHDYEGSAGKAVLDYGCGNGYVLAQYARHGAAVSGVDVTEKAIELARARFGLLGLEGTFVQGDGTTIPFLDESFDVACSMGVLHHIPDPKPVVAELSRVLRPGGKLVVMVYNRDSYRYRVTYRLRRGPNETLEQRVNRNDGRDNPYGRVYSEDELRALLGGFEGHAFRVGKLPFGEIALWWSPGERVLTRVVPRRAVDRLAGRWGWNLYCVARKPAVSPTASSTPAAG
jgi:SAM-dependent methyltransferase